MSNRPLVSVITPTYNQAAYLGECLQSVANQTYANWEQIVIDDGSNDSTLSIVKCFLGDRTKLVRRGHLGIEGLAAAYNTGLSLANGELIAILEGDDAWPASKLDAQVDVFESPEVVLSWGSGTMIDVKGRTLSPIRPIRNRSGRVAYLDGSTIAKRLLIANIIVPSSGVILRRAALERIGGFHQPKGIPYADLPTWLRLAAEARSSDLFAYTSDTVVYWRSHSAQFSRAYEDMVVAHSELVTEFIQRLSHEQQLDIQLDRKFLHAVNCFVRAKAELAHGNWSAAAEHLRKGWQVDDIAVQLPLIIAGISTLAKVDLFRITHRISNHGSIRGMTTGVGSDRK